MALNRAQRFTLIGLGIAGLITVLLAIFLLIIEGHAVAVGGHSTISELFWYAWANQPWAIWLPSVLVAFATGFLSGHLVGQSSDTYERIREKGL